MSEQQPMDEQRLRAVFRALSEQGVEYAVFGAVALGLHGLARATADIDLFIPPDAANIERLNTPWWALRAGIGAAAFPRHSSPIRDSSRSAGC